MALQSPSSSATRPEVFWTLFHNWSSDVHAGFRVGTDVPRGTIFVAEVSWYRATPSCPRDEALCGLFRGELRLMHGWQWGGLLNAVHDMFMYDEKPVD